jgi:hypothetical protein
MANSAIEMLAIFIVTLPWIVSFLAGWCTHWRVSVGYDSVMTPHLLVRLCTALAASARGAMLLAQSGGAKVMPNNRFTGVTNEARQARADKRAAKLAPIIKMLQANGVMSQRGIAKALNGRGMPTAAGTGRWYHAQVARVLARLPA